MQHTLNYIYKADTSKLDDIMGMGHDKRAIGENDHYYVIQDEKAINQDTITTDEDIPMCVETKFEIIKHTNTKQ